MCILFLEYHPEKDAAFPYVLVAASNRDENYSRETAPAAYWTDNTDILAGRDLEKKGTWLGLSKKGRFAVLTNCRKKYQEPPLDKRSRGDLVAGFLSGDKPCFEYCQAIEAEREEYDGFNLIVGNLRDTSPHSQQLVYYSNRGCRGPKVLTSGTYGLSNERLDSPWAKVTHGKKKFTEILANGAYSKSMEELSSQLLELMADTTCFHPDTNAPDTGHPEGWMRAYASVFVRYPEEMYGTRTSSVVLVDKEGKVFFIERTMVQPIDPYAPQWTTRSFSFTIEPT